MPNPELLEKTSLPSTAPQQVLSVQQFVPVALLFTMLSLSFWLFVSPAAADQQRPDAPGSITGRITNAQGEPLANMVVTLYRDVGNAPWYQMRGTQTQPDGYYRFSLVDSGIYRIGVNDLRENYAPTFYPASHYLEEATALTIIGNSVSNIDMVMAPGGAITGYITATALALGVSEVRLYEKLGTDNAEWRFFQAAYFSSGYPQYQLRGLPAGRYRLCAMTWSITVECYNNVYSIENALDLTVTTGITLSNINIAFGEATDAAQLHGRITSVDDVPLANIGVIARPVPTRLPDNTPTPNAPQPWGTVIPTALPYPSPTPDVNGLYGAYYTRTTTTGDYQFSALPAGTYQLQFRDPTGNYAIEYYDDALTEEQALPLELKERTVLGNINARLSPGARITGIVTVHGQPAQETLVGLYQQTAAGWRFVSSVQTNPFSGQYVLDGLSPGVYRLTAYASVYHFVGDVGSGTSFWGAYGGNRLEEGSDITLAMGETKTAINLNLTNGPQFNSAIAGRVTSGGTPVAGIKVTLYPEYGCCLTQPLVYVYTDAEGRYAIQGLSSGTFQLTFFDPAGIYARTFYKDKLVGSQADTIKVKDGETQTADVTLAYGGALKGTVQTATGQPVPNLYVMLYIYLDGHYELLDRSVQTDANGQYQIVSLQPGSYAVCFERSLWNYAGECYGEPEGWFMPSYAGPTIQIEANKTSNDIDLIWGPDLHTYLPLITQ